jgi:hypothetical protein
MDSTQASHLKAAIDWLEEAVHQHLDYHLGRAESISVSAFELTLEDSPFANFIRSDQLNLDEFLMLMLAVVPHLQPNFFSKLMASYLPDGGDFPEFGGVKGTNHRDILPTGETAQFILAGYNIGRRFEVQRMLSGDHRFVKKQILWLDSVRNGEPVMSGRLILSAEIIELFTQGKISPPKFSSEFPAEHIETLMTWDDLILPANTMRQIREIEHWNTHSHTLLNDWGMDKKIRRGYRALFFGPPGTGKTLTAILLGKKTKQDVYRIDLSRLVSKYIGETEQNLAKLFDRAENKKWILFFDEADALFGKRTEIRDAHDKYANQEVAYLLQRIENYNGLVILATNQRGNIDDAFVRRFQTIIHFAIPREDERYRMWAQAFPKQISIAQDISWEEIAARFELSGSAIVNIVHYCCIELLASNKLTLDLVDLEGAIMRELLKEGKVI